MTSRLKNLGIYLAALVLVAGLAASPALAYGNKGAKTQTFTGEVSDVMCGAKHAMGGDSAGCTRACVGKGSKYALVVGDKVYTLEGGDKAALDKLAGQKAKVSGTAKGDTIQVSSVEAGQ